jgi:hypothetical protein
MSETFIPVDIDTTQALIEEVRRLRGEWFAPGKTPYFALGETMCFDVLAEDNALCT